MSKEFSFKIKIYYEDTDAGGIVYYANYLKYLERARSELIYKMNLNHKILQKKFNSNIIVRSCNIQYKKPCFFEDTIIVYTKIKDFNANQFILSQSIRRKKELVIKAEVQLVTVNLEGKLIKIPKIILDKLSWIK